MFAVKGEVFLYISVTDRPVDNGQIAIPKPCYESGTTEMSMGVCQLYETPLGSVRSHGDEDVIRGWTVPGDGQR